MLTLEAALDLHIQSILRRAAVPLGYAPLGLLGAQTFLCLQLLLLRRRSPRLPFLLLGWQDSAEAGNGIESGRCGRLLLPVACHFLLFWTINPSASFPFCNVNNFADEVAQMVSTVELESSLWSSDTWVGKLLRSQKKYRKLTFVEDLESYLPEDP